MKKATAQIGKSQHQGDGTTPESPKPPAQGPQPHFLTPPEVAARLRVTPEQVRSLIRKGMLYAINVGAGNKRPLYRIPREALQSFLTRGCSCAEPMRNKKTKRSTFRPAVDHFPGLA